MLAFNLLYLNGKDLRALPLIVRKMMLKRPIRASARMFYLDHVVGRRRTPYCSCGKVRFTEE